MRARHLAAFLAALTVLAVASGARPRADAQQTTFQSRVDLTTIDVTVLDRNRRPVTDLTAADFTVLVDGVARPVVSFKPIALSVAPEPSHAATAGGDIRDDTVADTRPAGRVLVIVIDDANSEEAGDAQSIRKTRAVAHAVIDAMRPDDVAAVVFTNDNHWAQGFTRDRLRLKSAVNDAALFPFTSATIAATDPNMRGDCYCGLCAIETLQRVTDALSELPEQRKVILDVSVGSFVIPPASGGSECMLRKEKAMTDAFRSAARANVTINTFDPRGLFVGTIGHAPGADPASGFLSNEAFQRMQFLQAVAENTGGRAIVRNNDPDRQVGAVLNESGAYYLLGVETGGGAEDGKFHTIRVRVSRPGLEVRARSGFYTPTAKERAAELARASDLLSAAVKTPLGKTDIGLNATVAAFATVDRGPVLAVALGLTRSDDSGPEVGIAERIETVSAAFVPESGERAGQQRTTVSVKWPPADTGRRHIEVLSQLPIKPGRYELRFGVRSADDRAGSVSAYVDVPDFAREPLSLSGALLVASALAAPRDAFDYLLPVVPTARRTFQPFESLAAFARVYQDRSKAPSPVTVTTHLVDAGNAERSIDTTTIAADRFGTTGAADYRVEVPTDTLTPGEYALRIVAAMGDRTVERAVRFKISE